MHFDCSSSRAWTPLAELWRGLREVGPGASPRPNLESAELQTDLARTSPKLGYRASRTCQNASPDFQQPKVGLNREISLDFRQGEIRAETPRIWAAEVFPIGREMPNQWEKSRWTG
ncbi:hypothetical protein B0H14DRAFT_2568209 [Mycena olivaceomarginata]|nr:hypothetical protein B0H14DRAFT_2568209 [Mycena olivaceomarginata]